MSSDQQASIGQYQIVEQIGMGGMATVYKAYQPKLDRFVAVKVLHKMFLEENNFLARFEREGRIVAGLDHPNIVPVYDFDTFQGQPYLVMKYVEGRTLKDHMQETPLSLDEVLYVMRAVCDALTYAHGRGVLHRDIKPSNILIDQQGAPYITDFGLARIAQQGESTLSVDTMLGTPHYISPEQAQGAAEIDGRTDIYSAGIVLYELVIGRLPFTGDSAYAVIHKQINAAPPSPTRLNPDLPPEVGEVLLKALEKDPGRRYRTANEMMAAFDEALQSAGLRELDSSRVQRAVQLGDLISQHTPGGSAYDTVTRSERGRKAVVVPVVYDPHPQKRSLTQWFELLVQRVRALIEDIRRQLTEGNIKGRMDEAVHELQGSVQSAISQSGRRQAAEPRKRGAGTPAPHVPREAPQAAAAAQARQPDVVAAARPARIRERPVDRVVVDDTVLRERARRRIWVRRGFMAHLAAYLIVMAFLFSVVGGMQAGLQELFTSPDFIQDTGEAASEALLPLAEIPWAVVLALLWGGGLLSHALKVVDASAARQALRAQQIDLEMTEYFGPDWRYVASEHDYRRVRQDVHQRSERRIGLYGHIVSTIMSVAAGFVALPIIEQVAIELIVLEHDVYGGPTEWAAIFALLMALGVLIHAVVVFVGRLVGTDNRERAIQRELARERAAYGLYDRPSTADVDAPPKRKHDAYADAADEPVVRLTGDGEFTESFIDEINQDRGQRR